MRLAAVGDAPDDDRDLRLRKHAFAIISLVLLGVAVVFGSFGVVMGRPAATILSAVVFGAAVVVIVFGYRRSRRLNRALVLLLAAGMSYVAVGHVLIGGLAASGGVLAWVAVGPVAAMLIFDVAAARWWLAVAIGVVVAAVIADPLIVEVAPATWREAPPLLHALNVIGVTVIVVVLVRLVDGERLTAQRAYHGLLLRILPPAIVDRLTAGEAVVAQHHPSVSVVMADIAGFTAFADRAPPEAVLTLLTDLFSAFDRIVAEAGIEKIKTVGDAYLAVAGAPAERPDHADAAMRVAVSMQRAATSLPAMVGSGLQLRVGVASGPVTAGVIGTDKPVYDVWGDTVNVASRMESTGVVGRVQLSEATASALEGAYPLVRRRGVAVKGKGSVDTYLLDPASI